MKVKHLLGGLIGIVLLGCLTYYFIHLVTTPITTTQQAGPKLLYTINGDDAKGKLQQPAYAVMDDDGLVYIADTGNQRIAIFDQSGRYKAELGGSKSDKPLKYPYGIAVLKESIIVADPGAGALYEYSKKGKYLRNWLAGSRAYQPAGVCLSAEKLVYVSDLLSKEILVFTMQGELLRSVKMANKSLGSPQGLAVNAKDQIWIADGANYNIKLIEQNGDLLTVFDGGPTHTVNTPKGLAIDSNERIYVADTLSNVIRVFNRDGSNITTFGPLDSETSAFQLPMGISINRDNEIFIADQGNNKIQVWGWE